MNDKELKALLVNGDGRFWDSLAAATRAAFGFEERIALSSLRRKAHARSLARPGAVPTKIRLALLGGSSIYPLRELLEHLCEMEGIPREL